MTTKFIKASELEAGMILGKATGAILGAQIEEVRRSIVIDTIVMIKYKRYGYASETCSFFENDEVEILIGDIELNDKKIDVIEAKDAEVGMILVEQDGSWPIIEVKEGWKEGGLIFITEGFGGFRDWHFMEKENLIMILKKGEN